MSFYLSGISCHNVFIKCIYGLLIKCLAQNGLEEDQIPDSHDDDHLEVINHELKGVKVECLSNLCQFHQHAYWQLLRQQIS